MPKDPIESSTSFEPTQDDLKLIDEVLPAQDPSVIHSKFEYFEVSEDTTLPSLGMFVVLGGEVQLRQGDNVLATADTGDYFYEEHLEIYDIPVSLEAHAMPGARLAYLSRHQWSEIPKPIRDACYDTLFGDLVSVHLQNYQQPINCCSVTAAALSMSALGFSYEVNDIFRECGLPTSFVVNDGISLGELYDVACTFIHSQGLRDVIQVQAYFMDEATTSADLLSEAIDESNRLGGDNDILVANFQVGVAHGKDNMPGGHFAIIAKCNPSTGLVHMMDVHPEKYGKLWVTTVDRLWAGMSDRDGTSMRSRGMLRFSAREAVKTHLQTLKQDCNYVDSTRYLAKDPKKRRNLFRRASPNMNSLGVLAESLAILGDEAVDEDKLLFATETDLSDKLSRVSTAMEMHDLAQRYLTQSQIGHLGSAFRSYAQRPVEDHTTPEEWFCDRLRGLNKAHDRHLMINIDFNRVLGFEVIRPPANVYRETALLEEFWCLCIAYDEETDLVTVVDMSPATSQVWQAPRENIFRGLRDLKDPALLVIEEREPPEDPSDVAAIVKNNAIVLFYADEDPWSYMLRSILANIGITTIKLIDVEGHGANVMKMRRQLTAMTGKETVPYLFFQGECLGRRNDIVDSILKGHFQKKVFEAGLPVLLRHQSPSLDNNIFGYPKGGLTEPPSEKRNVLLCACGSSAADKVPQLVKKITAAGHNVKLIPSVSAEKFFRDIEIEKGVEIERGYEPEKVEDYISHNDYYRDDDEWNFRYTKFGMPLRASHLALCDWADCVIVAPVTCNTMGKIANGIADNLLTSVFVAWQYRNKPAILCPACNTNMWNNVTTQRNVEKLRDLGVDLVGPRKGRLSNGMMGIGMMATPDQIMEVLDEAFEELADQEHNICKWAQEAAASDDFAQWRRVFDAVDKGMAGIDIVDDSSGDTLLHYAAGGEGELHENGKGLGKPDLKAAQELINRGINVNATNDHGFTSLHVAVMNNSVDMVKTLLGADGIDASACIHFLQSPKNAMDVRDAKISDEVLKMLSDWANTHTLTEIEEEDEDELVDDRERTYLYFTYGSLKKGFPNHEAHAEVLDDFVGEAVTRQRMPLIVPHEPHCDNPNCGFLHRMATLVDQKGRGKPIRGEVYRVTSSGLKELDRLEGYHGPGSPENVYVRKRINVLIDGVKKPAYAYVIAHPTKYLDQWEAGTSGIVAEYTLDMATGTPKPGFQPPSA
ncbi:flavoprotein [Ruegeria sp. R14_0]|uniref:flavoprotein n=1 Tax=Ruegeria sp. R14_0 TaxID=2821100 RepID=UPI001ADC85D2|nr:gamma-glutamylcyclotransferase [Ruegeria sp. R14_0]